MRKEILSFRKSNIILAASFFMISLFAISFVPAVFATTSSEIDGTFVISLTGVTSVRTADGNTITSYTFSEAFTGSLVGIRTGSGTLITHPDGTANSRNCGTFTGSVLGISGTLDDCAWVQGTLASFNVQVVYTHGTGGLAGAHGVAKAVGGATGPTTFAGTYSGEVHFAP